MANVRLGKVGGTIRARIPGALAHACSAAAAAPLSVVESGSAVSPPLPLKWMRAYARTRFKARSRWDENFEVMNHEVNSPAGDAKSKPLQKDLSKVHVR